MTSNSQRPWLERYPPELRQRLSYREAPLWSVLEDSAARHPGLVALRFFGRQVSYAELWGAAQRCASALAATLAEHEITVNCICPGFFPTRMSSVTIERSRDKIIAATPLRRVGNDQDLKGIAVLFASDASSYITGQVIAVDGGQTAI